MSERPSWSVLWQWAGDAQSRIESSAANLTDEQLGEASPLTDWTRGHVLAHLSQNARALTNLLTWAETGIETPMYPSQQAREEGIAAAAGDPLPVQLSELSASAIRLRETADALPESRRTHEVRSAQGRTIPALEIPWMRNREVWLHYVDLDVGFTIDDLPADFALELIADVAGWMSTRTDATVDLRPDGGEDLVRMGSGPAPTDVISGSPQQLAGWLTGRLGADGLSSTGEVPVLPAWL